MSGCDKMDDTRLKNHRKRRLPASPPPRSNDCPNDCSNDDPAAATVWNNELHKEFVRAVFEIGIEHSSPAVIAEQMITKNAYNNNNNDSSDETTERSSTPTISDYYQRELTGERLKSHLQKLRKQKDREIQTFLEDYDNLLVRERKAALAEHRNGRKLRRRACDETAAEDEEERLLSLYLPTEDDDDDDDDEGNTRDVFPAGGTAIGKLTLAVQTEDCDETNSVGSATSRTAMAAGKVATALECPTTHPQHGVTIGCSSSIDDSETTSLQEEEEEHNDEDAHRLSILRLTQAETNSPLGVSLRLTWDLIRYMHGVLAEERTIQQKQTTTSPNQHHHRLVQSASSNTLATTQSSTTDSPPFQQQQQQEHTVTTVTTATTPVSSIPNGVVHENLPIPNRAYIQRNPHLEAAFLSNGPPPATLMAILASGGMAMVGNPRTAEI